MFNYFLLALFQKIKRKISYRALYVKFFQHLYEWNLLKGLNFTQLFLCILATLFLAQCRVAWLHFLLKQTLYVIISVLYKVKYWKICRHLSYFSKIRISFGPKCILKVQELLCRIAFFLNAETSLNICSDANTVSRK